MPRMHTLGWLLQIAGLCLAPMALMAGLSPGEHVPESLPTLELRVLALAAICFLAGRALSKRGR